MNRLSPDAAPLPEPTPRRLICGVVTSEWNYAVVYVRNPSCDYKTNQKFYFTFFGTGDYYLEEIATYIEQWTYCRGDSDQHYPLGSHAFNRARKMACQSVGTFRRNYLQKHGSEPNPLLLERTLDEAIHQSARKSSPSMTDTHRWAQTSLLIDDKPL